MQEQEKQAIVALFDKEVSFTEWEKNYLNNTIKKTHEEYLEDLLIRASAPYREKIDLDDCQGVVIKHFTTDEKEKGVNLVILHKFYESKPLIKKFEWFFEAEEFYHLIINYMTNPELLYEDGILNV